MRPISRIPHEVLKGLRFVLADIDDTMTTEGRLRAPAYQALWDLADSGIAVIPVTGRPAGWCDLICRQWPVDAVVGENGAFAFSLDAGHLNVLRHPLAPEPAANRERLAALASQVYELVPGTRPAKDQFARLYDVAVDFREEPPFLGLEEAEQVRDFFEHHGARAKVSSIHVNAWFGEYDKLSMVEELLRVRHHADLQSERDNHHALFVGDSPNDEPMFAAFSNSVGVSNIRQFTTMLTHPPAFVTASEAGQGFVELARHILVHRR